MARELIRKGGRSARIQEAVHAATRFLLAETPRSEISVPMIAERAGVTPSTIYRRWGDLPQLLSDVAAERLRPRAEPDDTGSLDGDLEVFLLRYAEEMSSPVGRRLLRDVLAEGESDEAWGRCCRYTSDDLETLRQRAVARGEDGFDVDEALDLLIAPIVYRILFSPGEISPRYVEVLLARRAAATGERPARPAGSEAAEALRRGRRSV